MLKIIGFVLASLVALYGLLCVGLYAAISRPPERFGAIMQRVPDLAFMVLPFRPLWTAARAGELKVGDPAPDFELTSVDRSRRVRLSVELQTKPVVLVFGSYT